MAQFIRTRVTIKLGLLLFGVFLLIAVALGNIVYTFFVSFYVSHVWEELTQRTESHAAVLSDYFNDSTIDHVVRMEVGANFMVVILDSDKNVLGQSDNMTSEHHDYLDMTYEKQMKFGATVEQDWDSKPFLVDQAPVFQGGKEAGTVVLFSSTTPIREAIQSLQRILLTIGLASAIIVGGILFLISRMIARPLLVMRQVTSEIAKGNYDFYLPLRGEDEVAQLAHSIHHMSREIQFYQKQRNDFLADIGHELRTPLTYLKGYSELILGHDVSNEEKQEYLTVINEQSERLQRLVQDLFDLARIDQGVFSFHWEKICLEDVLTDTLSVVESSMDAKGILIEYCPPEKKIMVKGDRQRLGQVFINILDNARYYTPEGGSVFVRYQRNAAEVIIEIEDTGPGIPKAELPFITERLYRVEKSRSKQTGGAGLGLAISSKIIEKHQGYLQIESAEGEGTTFKVNLPLVFVDQAKS
ncbi:sensor histidine kinase [Ammoniphilus oxalaticus]|nr:HAMP domain-containing sensor histidine kinase [Ammoniphilus oxalaticus]